MAASFGHPPSATAPPAAPAIIGTKLPPPLLLPSPLLSLPVLFPAPVLLLLELDGGGGAPHTGGNEPEVRDCPLELSTHTGEAGTCTRSGEYCCVTKR